MNDPDIVLKLYNGLIQKDVFSTPVGIAFLRRLRAHLNTIPYIRDEDLLPLPVQKPAMFLLPVCSPVGSTPWAAH